MFDATCCIALPQGIPPGDRSTKVVSKEKVLQELMFSNPRGADVGTKVSYVEGNTCFAFRVEAEQVWRGGDKQRVMGLVWAGTCAACGDGFFQLTPTHPTDFNHHCQFCSQQRFETFNSHDTRVFDPQRLKIVTAPYVKRRGRVETLVLETIKRLDAHTMTATDLIDAVVARMPAPEEDKRDTRKFTVTRALNTLNREKDGLLKLQGDLVIFCG